MQVHTWTQTKMQPSSNTKNAMWMQTSMKMQMQKNVNKNVVLWMAMWTWIQAQSNCEHTENEILNFNLIKT